MNIANLPGRSDFCRLCGNVNQNGNYLFTEGEKSSNLCFLINKYLPLKVEKDGKYPDRICPGCEIQLEATKIFFDLIIEGQNRLKLIYDKLEEEAQLKNLQNISSKIGTFEIQSDETGEKYFIQIMDSSTNQSCLYSSSNEIMTNMNILTKGKKKRGRPRKQPKTSQNVKEDTEEKNDQEEIFSENNAAEPSNSITDDGKRQRKLPARFSETVQGKELDDILKKEGIEEEDFSSNPNDIALKEEKIIGRIENENGNEPIEAVIITKNLNGARNKTKEIQSRRKRRKFKCEKCCQAFRYFSRLETHFKRFHNNNGVSEENKDASKHVESISVIKDKDKATDETDSNHCSEKIDQRTDQEKIIIKEDTLKCDQCDKTFSNKQNFDVHLEAVHNNRKPFTCLECQQTFSYAKTFRIHQLKHKKTAYYCEICQKTFNHRSSLIYHRNAEHTDGKRYVCNKCNKIFKHRQLLQRHQLVHTEDRPFKCDVCDSAFKSKAYLLVHNTIHTGEKNHSCTECGQMFSHTTSLKLHMRWHLGEKPFTCEYCSKKFSQKGNLLEHQRIHTGEKPFYCQVCSHRFTTSSQLKLHSKRHSGERPWKCEYCPKSFLYKDSWTLHCRRHLNDRPFKCSLCSRGFTAMSSLKKHMRYHTGEKPHSCDVCLKGFTDFSNLTKHKRIHQQKSIKKNHSNTSLLYTADADNLFYVYYDASKDQTDQVSVVDLGHTPSEEVITSEPATLEFKEDSMQFQQLVDQEGNPLSLNTQDGQQINVVTSITNGEETLQGLLPDGTLVAIDLQNSKVESMERLTTNVEEEINVSQLLLDTNMTFLNDNIGKPQDDVVVAKETNNICFITYDPNTGNLIG